MATDEPTPPPCNQDVFRHGKPVAALDGRSNAVERWVQAVAKKANAQVDWHYSGGIAQVLHLGDEASRMRVEAAITELAPTLDGRIMRRYEVGAAGLYREGVTVAPSGMIGATMNPLTGEAVFLINDTQDSGRRQ